MDTTTKITLSAPVSHGIEGQYIKMDFGKKKIVGKVLAVASNTTMTVRWYSRWQWFWISLGLFFKRLWYNTLG